MKKIILTLLFFAFATNFLFEAKLANGATHTPTSETEEINRLEKLKELIASTAAKKNLVDKKGIVGTIKDVNGTKIIASDFQNQDRIIDIDELTKFDGNTSNSFGLSDLQKGDALSFIGLFNKETERLLARFVYKVENIPFFIDAGVIEKNTSNFTINIMTSNGEEKTVNVESSTKTISFDKKEGMIKSGYSKIESGQRIIITGFKNANDDKIINASRIIHFLDLPTTSQVKKYLDLFNSDSPISTGSGKRLTPITR